MKITIIGSGTSIVSCAAFNIAIHKLADELVVIGSFSSDELETCVSDLTSATTGLNTLVRTGKYEDMRNSDIVIIADEFDNVVASLTKVSSQNLSLIQGFAKKIVQFCPEAIVITAANPVDSLNYAMYRFSGLDRKKFIGYSANDSVRFRMFLSQALGVKSSQLKAIVIGESGNNQILLFSSVKINGKPYAVSDDVRRRVQQEVANLPAVLDQMKIKTGRTTDWTTSTGLTSICQAMCHNTGKLISCSVVLDGEYGCHNMGMSVPVKLGKQGVSEIQELKLFHEEQEGLKRSIETLQQSAQFVDKFIGYQNSRR